MTSVADLVETTKAQLTGTHRGQYNFLASGIDDIVTQLTVEDEPGGINSGALLSIDDEIMYVRTATPANKTCTVHRGWLGSTPAAHAENTPIEISPRFPRFIIKNALRDEIRSWGSGIFAIDSFEVVVGVNQRALDLTFLDGNWYQVLSVFRSARAGLDADLALRGRTVRHSSGYPGGAFVLDAGVPDGTVVTMTVATPFVLDDWEDTTDLVDDCGLQETMLDIPPIGACWRLLSPREITRLDPGTQGEPRSAAEIQAGMIAATARGYKALRDTRLADETYRLRSRYPWRI